MARLYKWKVDPEPTGRYRSFKRRGWPTAYYSDDRIAASINCEEPYNTQRAKSGNHSPLILRIAVYNGGSFVWRRVKGEFKTLEDAKKRFEELVEKFPAITPE